MPALSWDALMRALKQGTLAPVYYLVGAEDLLKDDAVRAITDRALDPALRDFNLDIVSAASLDDEGVQTLCTTLPMMAERRIVIIRDIEQWRANARGRKALLAYLDRPAVETVLILVQAADEETDTAIAGRSSCVDCARLPSERAVKWALHEARQHGLVLPEDAARHLVNAVETEQGIDLGALRTEVAKLASLAKETVITPALVGEIVGVRHGETPGDWLDAVLGDDTPRALGLLDAVLAASSGVRLVMILGTALCGVQLARALKDNPTRRGSVERALVELFKQHNLRGFGSWSEAATRWSAAAERWTGRRLDAALRAVLDADVRLKQTTLDDDGAIVRTLMLRLAAGAAAEERAA